MINLFKKENAGGMSALKLNLWGMVFVVVLILIDMLTKIVADAYFSMEGAPSMIAIIPGYLDFRISYNTGIAFSIGATAPIEAKIALVTITGLMFVGLTVFYFFLDQRRTWMRRSLLFVVAGGIGNFIDRVLYIADPSSLAGVREIGRAHV